MGFVDPVVKKPEQSEHRYAEENAGDAAYFTPREHAEDHGKRMKFHAPVH